MLVSCKFFPKLSECVLFAAIREQTASFVELSLSFNKKIFIAYAQVKAFTVSNYNQEFS